MSRKPKKGYFVRGEFVVEGSARDLELKAELKGGDEPSRTDRKRESEAVQKLGEQLLDLRADWLERLDLPEALRTALEEARRIHNFEGRRRHMQYIGKLMRGLDADTLAAVRTALEEQSQGSAAEKARFHEAERWRERLLADDEALHAWLTAHPVSDAQHLRTLIRQARKDAQAAAPGGAVRHGRAYRELFQSIQSSLQQAAPLEPGARPLPFQPSHEV